jgi:hypothetical protein
VILDWSGIFEPGAAVLALDMLKHAARQVLDRDPDMLDSLEAFDEVGRRAVFDEAEEDSFSTVSEIFAQNLRNAPYAGSGPIANVVGRIAYMVRHLPFPRVTKETMGLTLLPLPRNSPANELINVARDLRDAVGADLAKERRWQIRRALTVLQTMKEGKPWPPLP